MLCSISRLTFSTAGNATCIKSFCEVATSTSKVLCLCATWINILHVCGMDVFNEALTQLECQAHL